MLGSASRFNDCVIRNNINKENKVANQIFFQQLPVRNMTRICCNLRDNGRQLCCEPYRVKDPDRKRKDLNTIDNGERIVEKILKDKKFHNSTNLVDDPVLHILHTSLLKESTALHRTLCINSKEMLYYL
jgi:hypothetical protein